MYSVRLIYHFCIQSELFITRRENGQKRVIRKLHDFKKSDKVRISSRSYV